MTENVAPKPWLDERIIRALREAGPDEQTLALDRLAKRWGPEAAKDAEARLARPMAEPAPSPALDLVALTLAHRRGREALPSALPLAPGAVDGGGEQKATDWWTRLNAITDPEEWIATATAIIRDGQATREEIADCFTLDADDAQALELASVGATQSMVQAKATVGLAPEPVVEDEPVVQLPSVYAAPGALLLNPDAPDDIATEFIRRQFNVTGRPTLIRWQKQFYHWNKTFYEAAEEEIIRGQVRGFLNGALRLVKGGNALRFQPKASHVNEVMGALEDGTGLPKQFLPPMWLDTRQPARDLVVFRNAIVNLRTGEAQPLTHRLWVHSARDFDWDPQAKCPRWERFLEEIFPGDWEAQDFVEEWMGYCMTEETKFQKAAMFIGQTRSGKGTILRVIEQLVGTQSYTGLDFSDWLQNVNSAEAIIGKRVAGFSDATVKEGKLWGRNFDVGGIDNKSRGMLLRIIGEDTVTLGRKYLGAWTGRLPTKVIWLSNDVPNLNDRSGAMQVRFIKLQFTQSFVGRGDPLLTSKLETELPGIAVRCVGAYQRLCRRNEFVQPASGDALNLEVMKASSPMAKMAYECFALDPKEWIFKEVALQDCGEWCGRTGHHQLWLSINEKNFGAKLAEVPGFEGILEPKEFRPVRGQPRAWPGIRRKRKGED